MENGRETAAGVGRCGEDEDGDDGGDAADAELQHPLMFRFHKMLLLLEMGSNEGRKGSCETTSYRL